jgi:MFS family permease
VRSGIALGAVAAGVVGSYVPWNWCYLIGGVMGLAGRNCAREILRGRKGA